MAPRTGPVPAGSLQDRLGAELIEKTRTWPEVLATGLAEYLQSACWGEISESPRASGGSEEDPYWLLLPVWLARKYEGTDTLDQEVERFLSQVLWGQWTLFLSFRLQDDLYDGDARSPPLVLVANLLRLESERAFETYFAGDRAFWSYFRSWQEDTYGAAAEIDAAQLSQQGIDVSQLELYAKASSVFKVGAAAVCLERGDGSDLALVGRFADRLASAGQILDDLVDLQRDLERGRRNLAASSLSTECSSEVGIRRAQQEILRSILWSSGAEPVLGLIRTQLDEAMILARELSLPAAQTLVEEALDSLHLVAAALHRLRVHSVLGNLLETPEP